MERRFRLDGQPLNFNIAMVQEVRTQINKSIQDLEAEGPGKPWEIWHKHLIFKRDERYNLTDQEIFLMITSFYARVFELESAKTADDELVNIIAEEFPTLRDYLEILHQLGEWANELAVLMLVLQAGKKQTVKIG